MFEGTIPARTAALVYAAALRMGVSQAEIGATSGLDPALLGERLLRISSHTVWRIWELIEATAGSRGGQFAAAQAERGTLSVWDYLFANAPTLAESMRTVMELRPVVANPTSGGAVIEDGGLMTIRDTASLSTARVIPAHEVFTFSLMLRRMREATGVHLAPVHVALTQSAPVCHRHLVEEFGTGRIEFGAPVSTMTFIDAARLPTGSDPNQARIHRHYAQLLMTSMRVQGDQISDLRTAIHESLRHGEPDLTGVARRLAASPRTLQRRLHAQGTTWRDELDSVRSEHAVALLRETDLPVDTIAARLGYADARALRRAFIRWKGVPPNTFRQDFRAIR
ncbi:helix-turn-helix domain-containing protein [Nocardia sp. NPDC059240]|uniref:helix-turn-helix domain-containing protein n=1 Tax=Nocardia sp. NPDC059240 TaxID=3346786 RepID=UPI003696CEE8